MEDEDFIPESSISLEASKGSITTRLQDHLRELYRIEHVVSFIVPKLFGVVSETVPIRDTSNRFAVIGLLSEIESVTKDLTARLKQIEEHL